MLGLHQFLPGKRSMVVIAKLLLLSVFIFTFCLQAIRNPKLKGWD